MTNSETLYHLRNEYGKAFVSGNKAEQKRLKKQINGKLEDIYSFNSMLNSAKENIQIKKYINDWENVKRRFPNDKDLHEFIDRRIEKVKSTGSLK